MTDKDPNGRLNATILDPQRWGWTAGSGVADLLTPHEVRARRNFCTFGENNSRVFLVYCSAC